MRQAGVVAALQARLVARGASCEDCSSSVRECCEAFRSKGALICHAVCCVVQAPCLDACSNVCCSRRMQQHVLFKRCYKTSVYRRIIQDQCLDACYSLLAAHVTSMSHLTSHPLRIRYDIGNVDPDYFDLNSGEVGRKLLSSTSKVTNNTWSSSSNLALSSF